MKSIAIFVINIYRNYLSLFKLQQSCRFYPSCSEYAAEAINKHGFFKGCYFSLSRILRCHPYSSGGYDPVNEVN